MRVLGPPAVSSRPLWADWSGLEPNSLGRRERRKMLRVLRFDAVELSVANDTFGMFGGPGVSEAPLSSNEARLSSDSVAYTLMSLSTYTHYSLTALGVILTAILYGIK